MEPPHAADPNEPELPEHPRGTLFIVFLYGVVFAVGWLLMYFLVFLPRGPIGG